MLSARLLAAAVLFAATPLAARAADSCGLLSSTELQATTSDPVTHAGGVNNDCIWSGAKSTVYISVRDAAAWAKGKSQLQTYGHIEPVSGVGSDAFFLLPGPKPTFYALKGTHFIILRVNVASFSEAQTKSACKDLATKALAKL